MNARKTKYYDYNITTIKTLGERFKVCTQACVRAPGVEMPTPPRRGINDAKLDNNIVRARTAIAEYGICNEWRFFVTLTLDRERYDRHNLKKYVQDLGCMINDYNKRKAQSDRVKYLLIPEQHKDGAWHMHGLMNGIREDDLVINEHGYLDWIQYTRRFGYMSLGLVKSPERVSRYITKYITKDVATANREVGAHLYYCSQGLKRAETIFRGTAHVDRIDFAHESGFSRLTWCETDDELAQVVKVVTQI